MHVTRRRAMPFIKEKFNVRQINVTHLPNALSNSNDNKNHRNNDEKCVSHVHDLFMFTTKRLYGDF